MKIKVIDFALARFKPRSVRVNLSSTFPVRSKCRFCMKGPEFYLEQRMPPRWYSPKRIQEMEAAQCKFIRRMCQDFYWEEDPKEFTGTTAFNWYHSSKGYSPTLHAKRGFNFHNNITEFLTCGCGRTGWAFNQKMAATRDDIANRKARYKYPKKFDDWFI